MGSHNSGHQQDYNTCNQIDLLPYSAYFDVSILRIGKTFAIENSVFDGQPIDPKMRFSTQNATIFHFAAPRVTRHISQLYSQTLVNYIVDNLETHSNISKESNRWILDSWLAYLSNARGINFQRLDFKDSASITNLIKSSIDWRNDSHLDFVSDITSLNFFKTRIDHLRDAQDPLATRYERDLAELIRFKVWFSNGATPQIRADSLWAYIVRYRQSIVVDNLINLLWVASQAEKAKAIAALQKETGKLFKTPEEWTAWWQAENSK